MNPGRLPMVTLALEDVPWRSPLRCAAILILSLAAGATSAAAQTASTKSGAELYNAACAACHGADGRGTTPTLLGFDTPIPDFTDCSFSTVEPDADWMAVSHDGGPARAFDRRMPAFGDAMTDDELQRVLDYIRGFCGNPAWPRGELNMPRPLVTEKAFPENEAVLTTTVNATGRGEVGNELLYERRLGARNAVRGGRPAAGAGRRRRRMEPRARRRGVRGEARAGAQPRARSHLERRWRADPADRQGERRTGQRRHDLRTVRGVRSAPPGRQLRPGAGRAGASLRHDSRRP